MACLLACIDLTLRAGGIRHGVAVHLLGGELDRQGPGEEDCATCWTQGKRLPCLSLASSTSCPRRQVLLLNGCLDRETAGMTASQLVMAVVHLCQQDCLDAPTTTTDFVTDVRVVARCLPACYTYRRPLLACRLCIPKPLTLTWIGPR